MDAVWIGVSGLAGLVLGGGAAAALFGPWLASERSVGGVVRATLAEEQSAVRTLQKRALDLERLLEERDAAVRDARTQKADTEREVGRLAGRIAQLESDVARSSDDVRAAQEAHLAARDKLANTERSRDAVKKELASAQAAVSRLTTGLMALGLRIPDQSWSPIEPNRRAASRDALREFLVDTGASAVALVDRDGLAYFGIGPDVMIERLVTAGALLGELEPALGVVACAPPKELTIATRRGSSHVVVVPGTPWLLAVENQGALPRHAVHHALLALTGRPLPAVPVTESVSVVPESTREADPALERSLRTWGLRHRAEQVALLDAAGHAIATTDASAAGALLGLRRSLGRLLGRLTRDRWPLSDLELLVRSEDLCLSVRPLDDDRESPVLVVAANSPTDARALDELAGSLRWHLTPSRFSRAAG